MKKMKTIVAIALLLLFLTLPLPSFAQGTPSLGTGTQSPGTGTQTPGIPTPSPALPLPNLLNCPPPTGPNTPPCFLQIFQDVIGRLLLVIYPLLAGMVFYGGMQMMFARGNTEKYKAGLKTIQYAVIGFVVIVLSQGLGLIIKSILGL